MSETWLKVGILLALFLFIDGAVAWLLGIEFSDPIRHSTLYLWGQVALFVGPILLICGGTLAFVTYYYRAKRRPAPTIITPLPPTQPTLQTPPTPPAKAPEQKPQEAKKEEKAAPPERKKK